MNLRGPGLSLLLVLGACDGQPVAKDDPVTPDTEAPEAPEYTGVEPSAKADLRVKRWRQLSLDLQGALALTADQICKETGLYECTTLHVVPLGGVSVANGLFAPVETLSVTSGLATERVVMQACYNRLALDLERVDAGQSAVVFSHIDLRADTVTQAEAQAQATELYRRLLARDPEPVELSAVVDFHAGVLEDGGANADWAVLTCTLLGTTTEALLY